MIKEEFKKVKTHVSLDEVDLPAEQITETEETTDLEDCLQSCLQELSNEKRDLIIAYYAKEKQAKIDHRSELAQQLRISVGTLRVRVYRIRESLVECIESCLERKTQQ